MEEIEDMEFKVETQDFKVLESTSSCNDSALSKKRKLASGDLSKSGTTEEIFFPIPNINSIVRDLSYIKDKMNLLEESNKKTDAKLDEFARKIDDHLSTMSYNMMKTNENVDRLMKHLNEIGTTIFKHLENCDKAKIDVEAISKNIDKIQDIESDNLNDLEILKPSYEKYAGGDTEIIYLKQEDDLPVVDSFEIGKLPLPLEEIPESSSQNQVCEEVNSNLETTAQTSGSSSQAISLEKEGILLFNSQSAKIRNNQLNIFQEQTASYQCTSNKTEDFSKYDNLPTSYVMPFISPTSRLGKTLGEKVPLTKKLKGEFMLKIYESFSKQKIFYIGKRNIQIVNAILNTYPHLGKNLPYESAKHYWLRSISTKFANERCRTDATEEKVVRAKCSKMKSKTNHSDCTTWWEIPNYHPTPKESEEDSCSIESHKSWMQQEISKHSMNKSGISLRMEMTFHHRRRLLFIGEDSSSSNMAADILQQFPCLGIEKEAINEVGRLFEEANNYYKKYLSFIKRFAEVVHEAALVSKNKHKSYINQLFGSSNSHLAEDHKFIKLPALIASLLSENPPKIIGRELNGSHEPLLLIMKDGSVQLNVDTQPFIKSVTPVNATFLWIASYYLFNIIPIHCKKTFEVLQYLVFDIPKAPKWTPAHTKIIDLYNNMNL